MSKSSALKSLAVLAAAIASLPAMANSLTFQNVTFNSYAVDNDTLKLEILNATAATGDWAGINFLKAFEIKDIGNVTGASIASGPAGFTPSLTNGINSVLGCTSGSTPGACFSANTPLSLTSSMIWTIDFTGTGLTFAAPHLKVQFLETEGQVIKTGDLLSRTIPAVPEADTYAMLLAGLGLIGTIARRRKATSA